MNQSIVLVDAGIEQPLELTTTLEAYGFQVVPCRSTANLEKRGRETDYCVAILDLDNALVTNRVLRDTKRKYPSLQIIGVSSRPFHPELREAMRSYLYACVSKPLDVEELMYLVKSIFRDLTPT